jgi:hypothetical protein
MAGMQLFRPTTAPCSLRLGVQIMATVEELLSTVFLKSNSVDLLSFCYCKYPAVLAMKLPDSEVDTATYLRETTYLREK